VNYTAAPSTRISSARGHLRISETVATPPPVDLLGTGAAAEPEAAAAPRWVYYIKGELPHAYWLQYAVPVLVYIEGNEFLAQQPKLAVHAFGESPLDAIYNLREELVDHYMRLEEMADKLSPPLIQQRALLRQLLASPDA
jgi:hypothetical protein